MAERIVVSRIANHKPGTDTVNPMIEFKVELPPGVSAEEARLALAVKLFEMDRLSLGQAAKAAGYSKGAFMEVLGKFGVPVFAYPAGDLAGEAGD